jgi:hypothetical protein
LSVTGGVYYPDLIISVLTSLDGEQALVALYYLVPEAP